MERIIRIHIEKLPEGVYLGTSDDIQGFLVQGDTIAEVMEFAPDVARMLLEMQAEHGGGVAPGVPAPDSLDYALVLAA